MGEPAWWPSGISQEPFEESQSSLICRTSFGKTTMWNCYPATELQWWQQVPEDATIWGDWPQEVTSVENVTEDESGIVIKLFSQEKQWIARLCPLDVGQDASRIVRHNDWNVALQGCDILMPVAGWSTGTSDRILIYPQYEVVAKNEILDNMQSIISSMAKVHSNLSQFSTPNSERLWNDSLKSIEAKLNTNTLWRGPHSKNTVGLPATNFRLSSIVKVDERLLLIAQPRRLVEHLLVGEQRIPAIANLMSLEREFANQMQFDESQRKQLLETWSNSVPVEWIGKKEMSTVLGGPWLWRYRAVLLNLAHANAFGDTKLLSSCNTWLGDVSRLQAHLGTLRMWKAGEWVGYSAIAVGFYAWKMQTMAGQNGLILLVGGAIFAIIMNRIYWSKDPSPY